MTIAKAKALASDLIDAGCQVTIEKHPLNGEWLVEAVRPGNPVAPSQLAAFATTHSVTAQTDRARFS